MTPGPRRLAHGGWLIDRTRLIAFTFDGRPCAGFDGDTLASALLASGVRIVGRSFKYHRPRGIWCAGAEDPNGIADVAFNGRTIPNCRLTTTALRPGMAVRSVNASPSAQTDRFAFLDHMSAFLGPGFYYKTFMWPRFATYEAAIRRMAGLGRVDGASAPAPGGEERHTACDLLIVGAGPAGLACATAAAERGLKVVVADANAVAGGSLRVRDAEIDGEAGPSWAERAVEALRESDRVRLLMHTTAFGVYDHGLIGMAERRPTGDRLWLVRPKRTVVATGATERPMLFENNDRPGVMSAGGALTYLKDHGVIAGSNVVVATTDGSGYEPARQLAQAGARVVVLDSRIAALRPHDPDLEIRHGWTVQGVRGARGVEGVIADGGGTGTKDLPADALLVAGGFTPTIHLYCQAGGVPRWNADKGFHVPGAMPKGVAVAGAANGTLALDAALAEGHAAGGGTGDPPRSTGPSIDFSANSHRSHTAEGKRVWVDMLSDVTVADIGLAAREGFRSVEHLKRYTTLGMAPGPGEDQQRQWPLRSRRNDGNGGRRPGRHDLPDTLRTGVVCDAGRPARRRAHASVAAAAGRIRASAMGRRPLGIWRLAPPGPLSGIAAGWRSDIGRSPGHSTGRNGFRRFLAGEDRSPRPASRAASGLRLLPSGVASPTGTDALRVHAARNRRYPRRRDRGSRR